MGESAGVGDYTAGTSAAIMTMGIVLLVIGIALIIVGFILVYMYKLKK